MSDHQDEADIDIAEAERLLTEAFRGEGKRPAYKRRWRYRVIRHEDRGVTWFSIHEVYEDGDGRVTGWSAGSEGIGAVAWDPASLRDSLTLMLAALDLPVLREDGDTLVEVES